MITINGSSIPTPSEFSVGIMDLSKAERNANGLLIMERITTKRKLEMTWKYIEKSSLSTLLDVISDDVFFTVVYPDPLTGASRSGTFYVGDRTVGMIDFQDGSPRWKDIKFNFVER